MDNLQHALMFDSDDGDGFLDDCMPFIPTIPYMIYSMIMR